MFDFIIGLIVGVGLGIGLCVWAVWAVLGSKK